MKRVTLSVYVFFVWLFIASFPGSIRANEIYGCAQNSTGALRIVGARTRCRSNETRITWNNIQGMKAVVYGMVNLIAGGGQITPVPATFTMTHTPGTGVYKITFTPNPFTPAAPGTHGFDNAPTCIAADRNNPMGSRCTANAGYDTTTGAWNATINCSLQSGTAGDADFSFACIQ
jgi:hypothetical protein